MRAKLGPALKANYLLWPAAHVVNFGFVPSEQRILYINCVAVVWYDARGAPSLSLACEGGCRARRSGCLWTLGAGRCTSAR